MSGHAMKPMRTRSAHMHQRATPLRTRSVSRVPASSRSSVVTRFTDTSVATTYKRDPGQQRLIQHKREAYWFYRYLSIVYDYIVNPGHWTLDMREDALSVAQLNRKDLKVVDVGGGTGFCTQGIVKHVDPSCVTLLDQSDHQMAKAAKKEDLQGITLVQGDAEDLPFDDDTYDRYVSAGSIEYWPEPQRGICEAYRVIKPGGVACLIGPVHPTFPVSRFFADAWMLFPTEDEYMQWFTAAGFTDVQIKQIGPKWYRGERCHGLIMGCSVTGVKPKLGKSPLKLGPKAEESDAELSKNKTNFAMFALRLILGSLAGFYFFLVPIYMWFKSKILQVTDK